MYAVFEGIDGSGKSEQLARVIPTLGEKFSKNIFTMQEPDKSLVKFFDSHDQKVNATLMYVQRLQLNETISRLRNKGIVLSDRSFYSTFAYQGQNSYLFVRDLHNCMRNYIAIPDIAFVFLVPPEIAIKRIEQRECREVLDKEEEEIRKADTLYRTYSMPGVETIYIDANRSRDAVTADVIMQFSLKMKRMED